MRKFALCLALVLLAPACSSGPLQVQDKHTIARTRSDSPVEGRPTLGMPITIAGQGTVLVPYSIETTKGFFEADDPYSRGGVSALSRSSMSFDSMSYAPGMPRAWLTDVRWHNVMFHDMKTGEDWPLLSQRGVISQWGVFFKPPPKDQPWVSRALLFVAVLDDTNHDGSLNDQDARIAILTDADGRHPRVVTPRDAQVWSARYDDQNDTIYFMVASDTNHDGRFTFDDVAVPYACAANSQPPASPLISDAALRRAEQLLSGKNP
jgi:hypothetical protein